MIAEMQLTLLRDNSKTKTIVYVPIDRCVISEYNPRSTRDQDKIADLAKRIERNGFEITRALWAYAQDGLYHVFAGGNRLEAVKHTSIEEVPIVLHEGYSVDDYVGLADQDNENDEYHATVPIVDVWDEYKRLETKGWNHQRIADAKSISRSQVVKRIGYAELPPSIRASVQRFALAESHVWELSQMFNLNTLLGQVWLSRESSMLEIVEAALKKGGTAKHFADLVTQYNELIKAAEAHLKQLPKPYSAYYLADLQRTKARSKAALHASYSKMMARIADDKERESLARQKELDEAKHREMLAIRERTRAEQQQAILRKLVRGDARQVQPPHNIKLLFTDPPYGIDFQSNRRVVSAKAERIEGDDNDQTALTLLEDVLKHMVPCLSDDAFVLVWCDWRQQCATVDLLGGIGLTVREEVIWNKPNHTSGDLQGAPARKHEKFLFAVKGNPKLPGYRFDTVLDGSQFVGSEHPTEKPMDLITAVIQSCTEMGDLVADPFMGSGGVLLAAYVQGRDFWGCELNKNWHDIASDNLLKLLEASSGQQL